METLTLKIKEPNYYLCKMLSLFTDFWFICLARLSHIM